MALSDNIRHARLSQGITMEELANRIGTTRKVICKYEQNLCKPQPEMFVRLANALGTTCEQLVNDGGEQDE
jgi:transcriptional regulator with XRE-family HTH domain